MLKPNGAVFAAALLVAGGILGAASSASGAVVLSGFTLDEGQFGGPLAVHSNGTQDANPVLGTVFGDGSLATFSNVGDTLHTNGNGEAKVEGPFDDLSVVFGKA